MSRISFTSCGFHDSSWGCWSSPLWDYRRWANLYVLGVIISTLSCLCVVLIFALITLSIIIVAPFVLSFILFAFAFIVRFLQMSSVCYVGSSGALDRSHVPYRWVVFPCRCTGKWLRGEMRMRLEIQCSSSLQEHLPHSAMLCVALTTHRLGIVKMYRCAPCVFSL